MDNVKVSIIVPIYNNAEYLEQCVESLINQTYENIEVILVNDGSKDNSIDIIEKYAKEDNRIRVINQENSGQSVARNNGIKIATGEYVSFLDADDWAQADMIESLLNSCLKYDSDIAMCLIRTHDMNSMATFIDDPYLSLDCFNESFDNRAFDFKETYPFIFRICVTPWNKIFKKSILKEFPNGVNFEDNVFSLDCLLGSKISLVRKPLVNYRRASNTSYSTSEKEDYKKLDFFKVLELQKDVLKNHGAYEELKEYFKKSEKNTLIYWYKKLSDKKVKIIYWLKLVTKYPDLLFKL